MKFTNSLLEDLDPRSKIFSFLAIILCVVLTPITRLKDFGLYFLLILAISFFTRIAPGQIVRKACILIPFVLFIAMFVPFVKGGQVCWSLKIGYWNLNVTCEGVRAFLNIIIKSGLSVLLLVVASSTTTFSDFLHGLNLLRLPRLLVVLISFICHYIFVLLDDTRLLEQTRPLRYFGSRYTKQFLMPGYMMGVLFIRTFERAEGIYRTMTSCGFNAEMRSVKHFRFSYKDFLFIAGIIVLLVCIVSGLAYKIEFIKISDVHLWQGL